MRLFGLLLVATALLAADDVPEWVREATRQTVPEYSPKVSSVVLLQEEYDTIGPDGQRVMRERGVIKVLQHGASPVAYRDYDSRSGRIRMFQGWLLPPSGKATVFGRNAIVDHSIAEKDYYSERRVQLLNPGGDLEPGSVFAWEIVEEEKSVFTTDDYEFQSDDPVLVSRFILALPAGWEARSRTFNHSEVEPQISGGTYTWELRNLPWIEPEEYSPRLHSLVPRLGVNIFPAGDAGPGLQSLKDWSSVSSWLSPFADPAAEVTDSIRTKAAELTNGAQTELDKIRAIAAFAQKTLYVAVSLDLNRGGGFTPHMASQVLTRNYGDCKDKATLMRALLKAAGIDSYLLLISADDRQFVRPEWPAPQFNHAIIAVRVSPETELPTVLDHPRLGRLLIFDPTASNTALGDLPEDEQGSPALVLAGAKGEIIAAPLLPAALGRTESRADGQLEPDGRLSAHLMKQYFGGSATNVRRIMRSGEPDALKKAFERGLAHSLGGIKVDRIEPADKMEEGTVQVKIDFNLTQFGQIMQDRLLVVSPGALGSSVGYAFTPKLRTRPVQLFARMRKDSVTINVPAGFKVDEMPDPARIESAYGSYHADWKAKGNQILFEQVLEVKDTLAPAGECPRIKEFFEKVKSAQDSPVVLLKQ